MKTGGLAGFLLLQQLVQGRRRSLSACTCDCCITEPQRAAAADGQDVWRCALEQPGLWSPGATPLYTRPKPCESLCLQALPGKAHAQQEVDAEQFCFAACSPKPLDDEEGPQQGDVCGPASKVAPKAAKVKAKAVPAQLLAHDTVVAAVAAPSPAAAPAGQKAVGNKTFPSWSSVKDPVPEEYMRITEMSTQIQREFAQVQKGDLVALKNFKTKALNSVIEAAAAVEEARTAAQRAERTEKQVRALRDNVVKLARQEAFRQIPSVMEPLVQRARAAARSQALQQAERTKQEMLREAPIAGRRAAEPYEAAMKTAAATAEEYVRRGHELAEQAQAKGLEAQAMQREANDKRAEGDEQQANRLIRSAQELAEDATRLNAQADSYYKTSEKITKENVPAYSQQAAQAAYHAEVLVNPEAQPPLPPII